MNIAFFTDTYKPMKNGVVTVVSSEKKSLEKLGHNVFLFTIKYPGYSDSEKHIYRCNSISGSSLKTENRLGIVNYRKLYNFIKHNKIDVIHNHTEFTLGTAAFNVARKYKIPIVMTTHTDWEEYYRHYLKVIGNFIPKKMLHQVLKHVVSKSDYLLCHSKKIKDYYKQISTKSKSVVIPHAIEKSDFLNRYNKLNRDSIRKSIGINSDDIVGMFVGRISEEKRVSLLVSEVIKAFRQMKMRNVKFIVAGDGSSLEKLKKMVLDSGFEDSFIFTGFIKWEEIYKVYIASDYYTNASISETGPITAIEALFSGLPIVASNDPAIKDKLYDNENGYLVKDDNDFHRYIIKICEDSVKQRKKFSQKSLEISNIFTMEMHTKKIIKFYEYIIDKYEHFPYDESELENLIDTII